MSCCVPCSINRDGRLEETSQPTQLEDLKYIRAVPLVKDMGDSLVGLKPSKYV